MWQDSLWAPGQPDNSGEQDCAMIDPDGVLYDEICDEAYYFICEITPKGRWLGVLS